MVLCPQWINLWEITQNQQEKRLGKIKTCKNAVSFFLFLLKHDIKDTHIHQLSIYYY